MKKILVLCLITQFLSLTFAWADSHPRYDALGGWMELSAEPRTFFYTERINGVWWFIDPGGKAFLSKGVNHISYTADYAPTLNRSPYAEVTRDKYENQSEWAKATAQRLRNWGFNSIGAWSSESMRRQEIPYTFILNIAAQAGGDWEKGIFPDVFSKEFERAARRIAQTQCWKRKDDIYLLGYFTDNELRWGPDWRSEDSLLISYLKMDAETPGRLDAVQFLQARYKSIQSLNDAWEINAESFESIPEVVGEKNQAAKTDEADYQERIAQQYFSICREAIKKYDPNHLILGCRFAGYAPTPVLKGLRDTVDVISYNTYNPLPPIERLQEIHEITGKPIVIGEFSFKAMDSGLPNTKGAGKPVERQEDRAKGFTRFVTELMKLQYVIGYHWFEYTDEPAEGRFDGENSNYGLVTIKDEPWDVLTEEMTRTNSAIEETHKKSVE